MEKVVLNEARTAVNGAIVGHSAIEIAEKAGLKVPAGTKMLLAEIPDATMEHPLALGKLSPVLALIKSDGVEDGFKKAESMLNWVVSDTQLLSTLKMKSFNSTMVSA